MLMADTIDATLRDITPMLALRHGCRVSLPLRRYIITIYRLLLRYQPTRCHIDSATCYQHICHMKA